MTWLALLPKISSFPTRESSPRLSHTVEAHPMYSTTTDRQSYSISPTQMDGISMGSTSSQITPSQLIPPTLTSAISYPSIPRPLISSLPPAITSHCLHSFKCKRIFIVMQHRYPDIHISHNDYIIAIVRADLCCYHCQYHQYEWIHCCRGYSRSLQFYHHDCAVNHQYQKWTVFAESEPHCRPYDPHHSELQHHCPV